MSRILEYQHADEQTVVARILLEVHQAIDEHFPNVEAGSRQFTKTLLTNNVSENTAIDQQPAKKASRPVDGAQANAVAPAHVQQRSTDSAISQRFPSVAAQAASQHSTQGVEFSRNASVIQGFDIASMEESWSSRWLTRTLVLTFIAGLFGLAWLYMFGAPF
jgi:hypothetical protein